MVRNTFELVYIFGSELAWKVFDPNPSNRNMRRFARGGTIGAILKTWKTPTDECYFYSKWHSSMDIFHLFWIVQMLSNLAKHHKLETNEFRFSELKIFSYVTHCIPNSLDTKHKLNLQKTFNLCSMSLGGIVFSYCGKHWK